MAKVENSLAFRLYVLLFPAILGFSQLDRFLIHFRGFGLVVAITKSSEI